MRFEEHEYSVFITLLEHCRDWCLVKSSVCAILLHLRNPFSGTGVLYLCSQTLDKLCRYDLDKVLHINGSILE